MPFYIVGVFGQNSRCSSSTPTVSARSLSFSNGPKLNQSSISPGLFTVEMNWVLHVSN